MPGVFQQSADRIVEECREVESLGIPGVILFGLPETKDPRGSSLAKDGVVQSAIAAIRKAKLNLWSSPTSASANIPITAIAA